jgi:hypothetical protein
MFLIVEKGRAYNLQKLEIARFESYVVVVLEYNNQVVCFVIFKVTKFSLFSICTLTNP